MAEVLLDFTKSVISKAGHAYAARACGRPTESGTWEGWIEFLPADGAAPIRSARETTQPNRDDTVYWATGVTPVFLEGSLERALVRAEPTPPQVPAYDESAPPLAAAPPVSESVFDPFSAYRNGEDMLRRQLNALSARHLVNVIRAFDLSDQAPAALSATPDTVLVG